MEGKERVLKTEAYMAICIQQDILRLQIPVHNALSMEMRHSRNNFCSIYTS